MKIYWTLCFHFMFFTLSKTYFTKITYQMNYNEMNPKTQQYQFRKLQVFSINKPFCSDIFLSTRVDTNWFEWTLLYSLVLQYLLRRTNFLNESDAGECQGFFAAMFLCVVNTGTTMINRECCCFSRLHFFLIEHFFLILLIAFFSYCTLSTL